MKAARALPMACVSIRGEGYDQNTERGSGRKEIMRENIDRKVWTEYFKEFSARNMARPTRLEHFDEFGAKEEEHGLPFAGIAIDTRRANAASIQIMFGARGERSRHFTHVIRNVLGITPKSGLDGRDEALVIVSGEGFRDLLRFEREALAAAAANAH